MILGSISNRRFALTTRKKRLLRKSVIVGSINEVMGCIAKISPSKTFPKKKIIQDDPGRLPGTRGRVRPQIEKVNVRVLR